MKYTGKTRPKTMLTGNKTAKRPLIKRLLFNHIRKDFTIPNNIGNFKW